MSISQRKKHRNRTSSTMSVFIFNIRALVKKNYAIFALVWYNVDLCCHSYVCPYLHKQIRNMINAVCFTENLSFCKLWCRPIWYWLSQFVLIFCFRSAGLQAKCYNTHAQNIVWESVDLRRYGIIWFYNYAILNSCSETWVILIITNITKCLIFLPPFSPMTIIELCVFDFLFV